MCGGQRHQDGRIIPLKELTKFDSLNYPRVKEFEWQADMKKPRFCLALAKTSKNMAVTGGDGGN